MNKIKGILISTLLLLSILTIIAPVSAGTIHVYPGDNILSKLNSTVSGDTVYIHAGTYTLSAAPVLSDKSLTIIGDGASSTIINFVGNDTNMYFYMYPGPSRTINISGITFKGDASSTPLRLLYFYNNDSETHAMMNARITDCVFDRTLSENVRVGAYAANMQSVTIENCEISNSGVAGIYVPDYGVATAKNCLFYSNNTVGFYAAGHSQTTVQSCTIDKGTDGIFYLNFAQGSVRDSIITNTSRGIRNDGSGTVTTSFNNIWNSSVSNYQGVVAGAGSISQNPIYATGPLGAYYLSPSSPCVNAGSGLANAVGLGNKTTRTDGKWDTGNLDMGYHYPSNRGPPTSLPIEFIIKLLKKNK